MTESQVTTKDRESHTAIEIHGLSKAFGNFYAVKGLNLQVPKNSVFAFLGPNGAGKTTTIKLLLGLTRPTSGGGTILGHDLTLENKRIRSRVGYMAQNQQYSQYMTPRQILRFAAKFFYEGGGDQLEDKISRLLHLVELDRNADRKTKGFSGGERQRLGIAQALINDPELLILDEPAAGLDPQGREDVLDLMKTLQSRTTIFYSTHILDDAQRVSDRVAILNKGSLVASAPLSELLAGAEGSVYTLTLKGNPQRAKDLVTKQSWVNSVRITEQNGRTKWLVSVRDEAIAEEELLRLILKDRSLLVCEFGMKKYELEEIFLRLVEDDKSDN
ncbi:MAG: ABC transporter ATP-binding protein [Candidatus Thorarchaeota archaeon]